MAQTSPDERALAGVLATVLLIGGAGRSYPLLQAIVEGLSLLTVFWVMARFGLMRELRRDWPATAIVALAFGLPALQLIPIPFETWAGLPGRALPAAVLATAGLRPDAMPLTLDPTGTRQAMLAMLPALALFVAGRNLSRDGRRLVVDTILAVAAAGACLGALQVVMGATSAAPAFASDHLGLGIGFFVNRNHQAAFMLVATCLAAGRIRSGSRREIVVAAGLIVLFGAAVLATTSRTALVLLPLCLLPAAGRLRKARGIVAAAAIALCAGFAALAWWGGALSRVMGRFANEPDARLGFWQTAWEAALAFFPFGSGIGSFKAVYPLFEHRDRLADFVVNHAHNDYLELVLEGGAVAVAGLLAFAAWYVRLLWKSARGDGSVEASCVWAIAPLLAFSAIEYPLRTLSLAAVFGLLCGLALRGGQAAPAPRPLRLPGLAALAAGGAAAAAIVALPPRPNDRPLDAAHAREELLRRPTSQRALAVLAQASQQRNDPSRTRALIVQAAPLGWRDPFAQLLLFAQHADDGRFAEALTHADALMRTGQNVPLVTRYLRAGSADPRFAAALAVVLARDPPWRRDFLARLQDLESLEAHATLLRELGRRGTPASREERGAFINRAIELGDPASAAAHWREGRDGADGNRLPDPRFTRIDADEASRYGLFGWHRTGIDGVTIEPGDRGAELRVDGSVGGMLLYQTLLLEPGAYRFTLPFEAEGGASPRGLGWTMVCATGTRARLDALADREAAPGRWTASFVVPPDCPVQRLALRSDGSGYGEIPLRLGTARLARTTGPNPP